LREIPGPDRTGPGPASRATASRVRFWSECVVAGHAGKMNQERTVVIVAAELRLFLRPGCRNGPVAVDGISSLGHVVESLGYR
jgi:hypothetical protein